MIEAGITSLLSADPTISGLVGNRIYPVYLPESAAYPCLSYQVASGSTSFTLGFAGTQMKRIQFDAWAETYAQCKQIESALAALMDGYSGTLSDGTVVISCLPGVVIDQWEDASRIYRVTAEYIFEFTV